MEMDLETYFENTEGRGILATADGDGKVDAAIYSRPHVMGPDMVGFIMRDRLSHHNLQSNPHAAYLFIEGGDKLVGKRLFLTKEKEETDRAKIESMKRRKKYVDEGEPLFLVYFKVDKILPLIGAGEEDN
jgi:hypothetical protein